MTDADARVTVRHFAENDRAVLLALASELTAGVAAWRPAAGVASAAATWVEDAMAGADRADHALLVAVQDEQVVGFLGVSERTHFSGQREAYIGELVVEPTRRRHGVARALLTHAQRWAAKRGLRRLTLETGCANAAALALYRALEFECEQVMLSLGLPSA